ncbi:GSCOCG00008319001-RA-CDS [Cotesia congregata]|uniref:Similar to Venom allergen 5 (Brachyponera chinensis) n=1 Tax=Cotesia congregata TaxID=51543 RepID=A0A8J2H496_COTCN
MTINVFLIFTVVLSTSAQECYPSGCNGEQNTWCKYSSTDPSPNCGQVESTTLTQEEKDEILKAHNDRRAWVANGQVEGQPAGIIPPLQWDEELAELARRWALQCEIGHDKCRYVDRFSVGQNMMWRADGSGYQNLTDMTDGWFSEHVNFDGSGVGAFVWQDDPQIGHYTQLIWGATTHLGCGVLRYYKDNWYNTYFLCDYAPHGNVIGWPVYETT